MTPFEPRGKGGIARWRIVYDLLCAAAVDDIVTYDQMAQALDLDPIADRHRIQSAMARAATKHEREDKRAVTPMAGMGYRVVAAPEQLAQARHHQRRSTRQLERGQSKVVNVDLSGVNPDVRHAFEVVGQAFAMQLDFNRRFDVRQQRLEQALDATRDQAIRTEQEVEDLRARLERLESGHG